jgi:hypothetical protein
MSPAEAEFKKLAVRYKQALEYEKTKYQDDSPEGQAWAEKEITKLVNQMNKLWNYMTEEERQRYIDIFK